MTIRKTVEAKDIELLSFSGRNPIGVPALKPGVVGGNFNNAGFAAFSNGGFNINGSRADENTITVDGAIAIRTRSAGSIIGVQNVDAIQEVQVLTANYLPEYGRASGGQIRFITKSGSSRYSGSGSSFWRDDRLQANTWTRNRSPNAIENSGPSPFDYKQYGYSFGGPIPGEWFKNKLFFFAAQEWVDFFQVSTNTVTVPTEAMRNGDFSQLLGANPFYSSPQVIRDPLTGLPFPGNIIPANRLSPNGIAMMKLYPLPTPGFQSGSNNLIQNSDNPVNQRKDNLRFDYRLGTNHSFTFRYSKQNYTAIDAYRGSFPFARTDWDRPNKTMNIELGVDDREQPDQRGQLLVLERPGVHRRLHRNGALQAEPHGRELPVHLPGQGNRGQDPDDQHRLVHDDRRRPVPFVVGGADPPVDRHDDVGEGPAHDEGRRGGRVLGRGRLRPDQRELDPGRHQQPERTVRLPQHFERADGPRHRRHGPGAVHELRGDRRARPYQLARAGHRHLRAGLLEAEREAHRRGRNPLRDLAAVVLDDEQHRQLRPAVLRHERTRR